ncbi:ComEA family DNA-binding protein [Nocardioides mangrovicus]|uniref:ComEA family DNA-binding protein n=2 Tax=Nocardioides mangrovicus TaxID=2478913 RepID=A0A3L8P4M3_9ACTN|nr:ComEA family DNA-binding protein [Nocardioides mangrovicus]
MTLHRGHGETVPAARFASGTATTTGSGAAASSAASPASPVASGGAGAPTSAGGSAGTVVVDVAGKVRRPGVVTLPTGSRVQDAISRAGGLRVGVAAGSLNLARVLVDGEQILVGVPGAAGAAPSMASATTAPEGGLVNLNSATLTQLQDLPGVGPVTAQKIMEYRTAHGAFTSVDQLLEVDGIGDKTLADIAPHATL